MYLGKVIGSVVTAKSDPCLKGKKLLLVVKLDKDLKETGDPLVAVDTVQAGPGDQIFMVTSREACLALTEPMSIIDAVITGIVDSAE